MTTIMWNDPPAEDITTAPTRQEIADELSTFPGKWAVVASHDRAARAAGHAERINSGAEYGQGYAAIARRVGSEHRVYAQKRGA